MRDAGHDETEKILKKMEKRIAMEYAQAEKEITAKLNDYLEKFRIKDELKLKALANGLITEDEYKQWRIGQLMMGKRWEEMRNTLAQDFTNADKIAKSIAYGYQPEVYAINHDYGTFQVEKASGMDTSYALYDRHSVEELMKDEDFIPAPGRKVTAMINENKDLAWNKKQVQSAMMQGIIQGESISKMATRLAETVGDSDRKAAIRNARTMTTGIENAGRMASYDRANDMGIKTQKQWLATLDFRTRHWHADLDGVAVNNDEPFHNEYGDIMYPGDPKADPANIYNCRCTMIASIKGFERDVSNTDLRHDKNLKGMSYEDWKEKHYKMESDSVTKQDEIAETMKRLYGEDYRKGASGGVVIDSDRLITEKDIIHENDITRTMQADNVEHREVQPLEKELTEKEIVDKIGGGDKTNGSCQSVALAYAGNKCGYDVTDYRGGLSQKKFARTGALKTITSFEGVISEIDINKNDYVATKNLLKKVENGKEYILSVAKHCAIIRKNGDAYEFLELQSETNNGWKQITETALKSRFGCCKSHSVYGVTVTETNILVDIDSLKGNADFKNILGYLNTAPDEQKKGKGGGPK